MPTPPGRTRLDAGGLKIGLALRYGILDDLEVGVQRVSNGVDIFDTCQFDAKYRALHADRFFVDVAVRAGAPGTRPRRGQIRAKAGRALSAPYCADASVC
jgi:hypothetical protein